MIAPRKSATRVTSAMAAGLLIVSACGGDSSNDASQLEDLIRSQTGEDVDIDANGDGSFNVKTPDGEFTVRIDSDGNIEFAGDAGSGSFDADGDGGGTFEFDGEDTAGGIDIDSDGSFSVTGEDGSVVGEVGNDGESFTFESDDGTFTSGAGIPEQWPSDIPRPEGLANVTGTFLSDESSTTMIAAGELTGDPDAYLAQYGASLTAAGFGEVSKFSGEGLSNVAYDRSGTAVNVSATDFGSGIQIAVTVTIVN